MNFTAAWCLTCIVSETTPLRSQAIFSVMERRGIVLMKADLTRRDAASARELADFGCSGVPPYVLHLPRDSGCSPIVMSQSLTEGSVLKAIFSLPSGR